MQIMCVPQMNTMHVNLILYLRELLPELEILLKVSLALYSLLIQVKIQFGLARNKCHHRQQFCMQWAIFVIAKRTLKSLVRMEKVNITLKVVLKYLVMIQWLNNLEQLQLIIRQMMNGKQPLLRMEKL